MEKVDGGKSEGDFIEADGFVPVDSSLNYRTVHFNSVKAVDRVPRLFFRLYYGVGAVIYTLMTIGVFLLCCFTDGRDSFSSVGVYDMMGVTALMWLSAALTLFCGKRSKNLRTKERPGLPLVILTVVLKVIVDGAIFFILISALRNPEITEANEFFQFAGPLIYHGLLYVVIFIEVVVILITVIVTEDRCGICPIMMKRGMETKSSEKAEEGVGVIKETEDKEAIDEEVAINIDIIDTKEETLLKSSKTSIILDM